MKDPIVSLLLRIGRQERQLTRIDHDYDDIPGTYVFDAERSRRGCGINMFCMSLLKKARRVCAGR
jgi:hypothetical protein